MAGRCLLNARIHPMAPPAADGQPVGAPWRLQAEAICWQDGRILALGSNREALRAAQAAGIAPEDASGLLVLPGFVDAHTHFVHIGVKRNRPALNDCSSLEEALRRTAAWLSAHPLPKAADPAKAPVIAEGWDESAWPQGRRPHRNDLDALMQAAGTPERPLVLRRVCGHIAVGNTAATRAVRRRWDSDDWVNLETGELVEQPSLYLNEVLPLTDAELDAGLAAAAAVCHALGLTLVGDYSQAPYRIALQRAAAAGRLALRVASSIYVQQLEAELAAGFRTGRPAAGDAGAWLHDGGLKVFHDGSLGARTAALRQAYKDAPAGLPSDCGGLAKASEAERKAKGSRFGCVGHPHPQGTLNWGDAEVDRLFARAQAAGVQVHAHAIGDAAIDQALAAYAELAARSDVEGAGWGGNRLRHRIEHCEVHHDAQLAAMAELGIVSSSQPNFVGTWSAKGGMYDDRLGARRELNNRFRILKEAGVALAFGSDGMPPGPLLGLQAATEHPDPSQRLEPLEAAWHYPAAAAWSLHWDSGYLASGRPADLVILEAREGRRPSSWRIRETLIAGKAVYKS